MSIARWERLRFKRGLPTLNGSAPNLQTLVAVHMLPAAR